ncbi:hypothetical protein Tco_0923608 [Tanacetum coccineum]|uniref:Uncharacterized protein n=1 Tax=Tanacetum coccineum TaxID=301880 RepID=A0ABQ5D8K9_9ASTR
MDHPLVEHVPSQVGETQLVVVVKIDGNNKHFKELMVVSDLVGSGMDVDNVVDDELLHKLVRIVKKNELVDELMTAIVDTEQNVTEFDGKQPMQEDLDIFHAVVVLHLHVKERLETLYSLGLAALSCQSYAYH